MARRRHAAGQSARRPLQDARCGRSRATSACRERLIEKAPSADLEADQTDEADLGITYARADAILAQLLLGYSDEQLVEHGFAPQEVALVRRRVDATHWKRHLPTTAMLSNTAINDFYLRPVDY